MGKFNMIESVYVWVFAGVCELVVTSIGAEREKLHTLQQEFTYTPVMSQMS